MGGGENSWEREMGWGRRQLMRCGRNTYTVEDWSARTETQTQK